MDGFGGDRKSSYNGGYIGYMASTMGQGQPKKSSGFRWIAELFRRATGRGTSGRVEINKDGAFRAEIEFTIEIAKDELDGGYIVRCLNLPGCISQGETEDEAYHNIGEAIGGVLAARFERNLRSESTQVPGSVTEPRELTVPVFTETADRDHALA